MVAYKTLLSCFFGKAPLLMALWVPAAAVAGGIDSGGGKLSKDDHNPWFLENTTHVSFCINSTREFGVDSSRLAVLVKESLSAWKAAFASNVDEYYQPGELAPFDQIRVATQVFVEDCVDPDLQFQFGTLTEEQRHRFESVQEFVGAAVRTDYDRETLRGKGFIYIAPMTGELKPDTDQLDPEAWLVADNALLRLVLLHELGHVFGVRHKEDTTDAFGHLMWERLPETLIGKWYVDYARRLGSKVLDDRSPLDLIRPRTKDVLSGCDDDSPVWLVDHYKKLLGFSRLARCARVEVKTFGNVEIFESLYPGADWNHIGTLRPRVSGVYRQKPLLKINLPRTQTVFTSLPSGVALYNSPLYAEIQTEGERWEGIYEPRIGKPLPMRILISNGNRLSSLAVTAEGEFLSPLSAGN